jgi:hypothetical protein
MLAKDEEESTALIYDLRNYHQVEEVYFILAIEILYLVSRVYKSFMSRKKEFIPNFLQF